MSRLVRCVLVAACVCVVVSAAAPAEEKGAPRLETRLKRVALFKNGLGFFVREASLSPADTMTRLGPLAAPAHGTFWVSAPSSVGVNRIVARLVMVKGEPTKARDLAELLRANIGKVVTIWEPQIKGVIVGFAPERPAPAAPVRLYAMGATGGRSEDTLPAGRGEYVLIKTEEGILSVNPYSIERVRFPPGEVTATFQAEIPGAELEATLDNPKAGDWLSVSYLAKGITWVPSYLIDISDPKQARLSAKAEIINEAEDLTGTHVDLITGFPNLKFADVISPLAMKADLAAFLQALSGAGPRPEASAYLANVITQSVTYRGGGGIGGGGLAPSYGAALPGQAAEDLFLYPVENVTLARGEIGYYPLFTESVPYKEFYEWEVPDYINPSDSYQPPRQPEQSEVVWHSIRLTNTTKIPWTTAPAEVLKQGQIIGQDVLTYTPASAQPTVTVKITQSPSVRAEQRELESGRERDAVVLYGDHFDRVTIKGSLQLSNFQDKTISVEVKKTISGDIKATSPRPKDVTLARGLRRMNPVHELTWTLTLKPQESQEISYTYQALIRR